MPLPSIIPPNVSLIPTSPTYTPWCTYPSPPTPFIIFDTIMSSFVRFNNRTGSLIFNSTLTKTQFASLTWTQSGELNKCMHMVLPLHIHTLALMKNTIFNSLHPMTNKKNSDLQKLVHISHFYKKILPLQIETMLMLTPFPTTNHPLFFLVYHPPHPIQKPIRHMHYEVFKVLCKEHYNMSKLYMHLS